jgi:hypothetical protein
MGSLMKVPYAFEEKEHLLVLLAHETTQIITLQDNPLAQIIQSFLLNDGFVCGRLG